MSRSFSSIRTQVGLLLVMSLGLSSTFALLSIYRTLDASFQSLEASETATNVERVAEVVAHELGYLGTRIGDWANWDDAAEYMVEKNQKFEDANLVIDVLDAMNMDSIRFYHNDRKLQGGVDRSEGDFNYLSDLLDYEIQQHSEIWTSPHPENREATTGILQLDKRYFMFASQAIRNTAGEGDPVGRLFFIKKLDESFPAKISQLVKLKVHMEFLNQEKTSDRIDGQILNLPSLPIIGLSGFEIVSDREIKGTIVANNSKQEKLVKFSFLLKRQLMMKGRDTISAVGLAFSVTAIISLIILAWGLNKLVVKRLLNLTKEVQEVGNDRDATALVSTTGNNEVSLLADQINSMLGTIRSQTKSIQDIINNVHVGFVTTDAEGNIGQGYTTYCHKLFGITELTGKKLSEVLYDSKKDREHFDCLYEQVMENLIPADLTLAQLPNLISYKKRWLRIDGAALYDNQNTIIGVLFTISDISNQIEIERRNSENSALLKIIRSINNFASFKEGTKATLAYWQGAEAIQSSQANVRRFLHTLKGNLGVYGLSEIAQLVHEVEGKPEILTSDISMIRETLETFIDKSADFTGLRYEMTWQPQVTLPRNLLLKMHKKALHEKSLEQLKKDTTGFFESALRTPFKDCVKGLISEGEKLATRLRKEVSFQIEGGEVLLDQEVIRTVLDNLIHAVRNALDHGIEFSKQRAESGKSPRGLITLKAIQQNRDYAIEISDDGRGIDSTKLYSVAIEKGLWDASRGELTEQAITDLIFSDGVSTATSVSDISGRGVGLAALKAAIEDLGGRVYFYSRPGQGSSIRVEWQEGEIATSLVA